MDFNKILIYSYILSNSICSGNALEETNVSPPEYRTSIEYIKEKPIHVLLY